MEELNSLNQALLERLCTLAHDLNNGLEIIAGYCELIAEQTEPGSQTADRLQLILTTVHRLAKRINGHDCRFVKAGDAARSSTAVDLRHEDANCTLAVEGT